MFNESPIKKHSKKEKSKVKIISKMNSLQSVYKQEIEEILGIAEKKNLAKEFLEKNERQLFYKSLRTSLKNFLNYISDLKLTLNEV